MEICIAKMNEGRRGVLIRYEDQAIAQRLISMGMMPGKKVHLVRSAPFNGAYYLKVDNHRIVVRDFEAQSIILNCE